MACTRQLSACAPGGPAVLQPLDESRHHARDLLELGPHIPAPIIAIYAEPHVRPPAVAIKRSAARAAADAQDSARAETHAEGVTAANPSMRAMRLPHPNHYVLLSNEVAVLHAMNPFLAGLADSRRAVVTLR